MLKITAFISRANISFLILQAGYDEVGHVLLPDLARSQAFWSAGPLALPNFAPRRAVCEIRQRASIALFAPSPACW